MQDTRAVDELAKLKDSLDNNRWKRLMETTEDFNVVKH